MRDQNYIVEQRYRNFFDIYARRERNAVATDRNEKRQGERMGNVLKKAKTYRKTKFAKFLAAVLAVTLSAGIFVSCKTAPEKEPDADAPKSEFAPSENETPLQPIG